MKKLSQEMQSEIEELTDANDHNEARLLITEELNLQDLYKEYANIALLHEVEGNLTDELNDRRNAADKFLFSIAAEYKHLF